MNKRHLLISACAGALALNVAATGAFASPFDDVVLAEILPGWETEDGTQMAGLRLTLAEGWKTYWRAPGDAGIPPVFDWSGSDNLKDVTLHWPRPEVFYQDGMRAIGYKDVVVLPIELTPDQSGDAISMQGQITLGVCLDVCLPVSLDVKADLPGQPQPAPIRAALDLRPSNAAQAGVGLVTCRAEPIEDGMRLTAQIPVAQFDPREVIVVETADPTVWVAETSVQRNGDALTAITDLVPENAEPFALDTDTVRITLLAGDQAVNIDGCALN